MPKVSAVVLAALGLALGPSAAQAALSPPSDSLRRLVAARGGDSREADDARYADLRKLDSHLQDLAAGAAPGRGGLRQAPVPTRGGRVTVDVYARGDLDAAARRLRALGMRVAAISRRAPQRMVEGELPVRALVPAARLDAARALVAVQGTGTNVGDVTSEGDARHRGPEARALGANGSGVTVGIVSDSINRVGSGVAGSQATGDLPADVQVLLDGPAGRSDEGRAMAEIVYDEAPGITKMLFHTGSGGPATRVQAIDGLVANGARVIADDTFQITEPFFQDGVIAQAADRARAADVNYVVSAGNRARQSWEGSYRSANAAGDNDFDPGAAVDTVQTVGTFTNPNMFVSLQWDEPWGRAQTDLAIDVYTVSGGTPSLAFTSNTDNLTSGLPAEFTGISGTGTFTIALGLRRVAGARNPFMKYIVGGTPTFTIAEHNVPGTGAIDPDASSAAGALTVGAIPQDDVGLDTPEGFSSRGPAIRRFDVAGTRLATPEVRQKPEIAGADGVNTTVPNFDPFFGTSASAPSVAGVAALIRSANPSLSADDVQTILEERSGNVDCTSAPGLPDLDCGFGFPFAATAVRATDSTPPAVGAALDPPAPTGRNGFYTGNVTVKWNASDASIIVARAGCDPSTVATDGVTNLSCTATSIGGPGTGAVTVKRDASPPSAPAIAGIAAGTIAKADVPSTVSCTASDPTSGVASCSVAGLSGATGSHTLTATAVNGAGLRSTSTLTYRVAGPAITKPSVKGRTVSYRLSAPAQVTFTVARCVKKKCKTVGRFSKHAKAGKNKAKLPKKVGGKRLKKGRYKVTLRAAGGGKKAVTVKIR